jgi:hypothetical protein
MLNYLKNCILQSTSLRVSLLPVARKTKIFVSVMRNWLGHYLLFGKGPDEKSGAEKKSERTLREQQWASRILQDVFFSTESQDAKNLFVIVLPEHPAMTGGLLSLFTIAQTVKTLKNRHNYHVLLMTFPNKEDITYLRQLNFKNNEIVFRFSQITRCQNADQIYLLLPEYSAANFIKNLDTPTLEFLKTRQKLFINILNQNIMLMPKPSSLEPLRRLAHGFSQSVAHHAYFGQSFSDFFNLSTILLPPHLDMSAYPPLSFENKEKLIIYSPDESPFKKPVLEAIASQLPDYELREIRNITYDQFMDLATRCCFSITFGEGFDGYLVQPMHQQGIAFAVYNKNFFPSEDFLNFYNIFPSGDAMISGIVDKIRTLENDAELYRKTNRATMSIYESLYTKQDYLNRIERLIHRDFDLYPAPPS